MARGHSIAVGIALLLAASPALAQRVVSVQATPSRAILGETASIQISVRGAGNLRAIANVGSVTPVQNGHATYTPPANRQPQVAVILVWGDGVAGAVAIPLLGRTALPVQTEPNATVFLEAGADRFGPVTADASGHATIPLRLSPGIHTGTIVARDRVGNETRRPADLGVPDVDRTLSVKTGEALVAGEEEEVTVAFAAAGAQGGALAGSAVSSDEVVVVSQRAGPGVLVAKVRAGERAGRRTVSGQFAGARTSITIVVAPGPPAGIGLTCDPQRVAADGRTQAVVHAAIVDAFGNPAGESAPEVEVEGADVADTSTEGATRLVTLAARETVGRHERLEPAHVHAHGLDFSADLEVPFFDPERIIITVTIEPDHLVAGDPGPVTVHIVAKNGRGRRPNPSLRLDLQSEGIPIPEGVALVDGEAAFQFPGPTNAGHHVLTARLGDSDGEGTLDIDPAEPVAVRARFDPERVLPGGESTLHVALVDRFGNRVPGVMPVARATRLRIADFREEEGEAVANVRLERGGTSQSIRAEVRAGDFATEAQLEVGSASPFFVGLLTGLTANLDNLVMFPIALEIGVRPPFTGRPISLAIEARWARGSGEAPVAGQDSDFVTQHLLLQAVGSFRLDLGRWDPIGEIGGGIAFTGTEVTPPVGDVDERSHTEPCFEIGGGVETALGPGRARAVLRYGYLPLSPPLVGDATGLLLLIGYRLNL